MTAGAKLAAFALVLGAMVAAGAALGSVVGPIDVDGGHGEPTTTTSTSSHGGPATPSTAPAGADHGGGH